MQRKLWLAAILLLALVPQVRGLQPPRGLARRHLASHDAQELGEDNADRVGGSGRRLRAAPIAGAGLLAQPPPPPPPTDWAHLPNFEIGVPAPPALPAWEWAAAQRPPGGSAALPLELSSSSYLDPTHPGPGFLAMCLIARDAHADLLEWINHHLRLGATKIYLWDHGSKPPMRHVIAGYIAAGVVEYRHFETFAHPSGKPQLYAYDKCLEVARGRHDWLAFLDVDEFLMFKAPGGPLRSLPLLLMKFQEYSGLAVHWLLFGSSGHETRPLAGSLRSYVRRLPALHAQHQLVKTIVRVSCTSAAWGPHAFHHTCAKPVVRTDLSPIQGPRDDRPVHGVLAVHHYATRSREEFKVKMARGSGMRRQRGWEYFDFVDSWSTEWDFDGLRIWDNNDLFQHYPPITQEAVERYNAEAHEEHWLRGLVNTTAGAAGAAGVAVGAAAGAAAVGAAATRGAAGAAAVLSAATVAVQQQGGAAAGLNAGAGVQQQALGAAKVVEAAAAGQAATQQQVAGGAAVALQPGGTAAAATQQQAAAGGLATVLRGATAGTVQQQTAPLGSATAASSSGGTAATTAAQQQTAGGAQATTAGAAAQLQAATA